MTSGYVVCQTHLIPLLAISFSEVVRNNSLMPIHAEEMLYAEEHAKWNKNKRFPSVTIVKLKSHVLCKVFSNYPWPPCLPRFPVDRCCAIWHSIMYHSVFWFMNVPQYLHLSQLSVGKNCLFFLQDTKFKA